jgi:hypothetical protein
MSRAKVKTMVGQLVFADVESNFLVLDCLLSRSESEATSVPVTLKARVPKRARRDVLEVLATWADEGSEVDVSISDTARGTEVEISSCCQRIVLQP